MYRLLDEGEITVPGDEFFNHTAVRWVPVPINEIGTEYINHRLPARRKIERIAELAATVPAGAAASNTASMQCPHFYRGTDGVHICIVGQCSHPDSDKWA